MKEVTYQKRKKRKESVVAGEGGGNRRSKEEEQGKLLNERKVEFNDILGLTHVTWRK